MSPSSATRTLLFVCFLCVFPHSAQAQPTLNLKRVINNWPTIEVYFTVACAGEQAYPGDTTNFEVYENGRRVNDITVWCEPPIHNIFSAALVFDRGASMSGDPILQAVQSGEYFVSRMDGVKDEACVIRCDSAATILQPMTTSKTLLAGAISLPATQRGKAVWDGCYEGLREIIRAGSNLIPVVLLFTDGVDSGSTHTVDEVIDLACKNRIRIYTLGYGDEGGAQSLITLATSTGGRYLTQPTLWDILTIIDDLHWRFENWHECIITYEAQCMNGAKRVVDLLLKDFCGGSDTKSRTFTAPREGVVELGSGKVKGGDSDTLVMSHNVFNYRGGPLPPATFTLQLLNPQCGIRFNRIDTPPGSAFNGVPLTTTIAGNIVTIRTTTPVTYNNTTHLANLIFDTDVTTDTCCSDILLTSTPLLADCDAPLTTLGSICVLPTTTAVEPLPTASAIDVFPDPNNGACFVTMSLDAPGEVELTVVDLFGRTRETRRSTGNIGSNTFSVDMRALPAGAYFLVCHTSTRAITRIVRHF